MSGLDFSIEQSRGCLLGKFQWVERIGSGFWCGELESDSTIESDYILFLYLFDRQSRHDKIARLAAYIARQQLDRIVQ